MECVLAVLERHWGAACEEVRRSSRCQREEQTKASVHVTWKVSHKSGLRKRQFRYFRPGLEWWMERGLANLARRGVPARDEARRSNRRQREEQTKVSVCTGDRVNPGESLARIGAV